MKIKILFKLIADSRTGYLKIMLALHIIKDEKSASAAPAVNKQEYHSGRYSRNREAALKSRVIIIKQIPRALLILTLSNLPPFMASRLTKRPLPFPVRKKRERIRKTIVSRYRTQTDTENILPS